MKKLLIIGGSGDLGRPLSHLATVNWDTVATYFSHPTIGGGSPYPLNYLDGDAVRTAISKIRPDVVIHTAVSHTDPEINNPLAASHIVDAAANTGAYLIVLSTDMLFDGTAAPYAEQALPTPLSAYGRGKAEMERIFLESDLDCTIVRTSLIYDLRHNRQIDWMIEQINTNGSVDLFTDELRSPIYSWNLAEALLELADHDYRGILHIAGSKTISRYDYGCALLRAVGYDAEKSVNAVKAAEVAPSRPRNLTFNVSAAQHILNTKLLSVEEGCMAAQQRLNQGH